MRRRAKRDLSILVGIVAIIAGVVAFNGQMTRGAMVTKFDKMRRDAEVKRLNEGLELLSWDLLRKTKGSLKKGGNFSEELFDYDGKRVNLMGYMVPQEQFRDVTEFLFLPLPIECYFCQIPPERDVLFVKLAEGATAQIYEEPVLINGVLDVHEGPGVKFFYSIADARLGPGDAEGELHRRQLKPEHMIPQHEQNTEDLLDPVRDSG
jgi:hypothetical protein